MKTDRLYAITIYLLNHDLTSASELARHFEVSVRTIQRDIDSLCCAGIPVIAMGGSRGGYRIAERFKMDNQILSKEEFPYLLAALKGLSTATNNRRVDTIYEKISTLSGQYRDAEMILDFSVLREGDENLLQMLQSAALHKRMVAFTYTNNNGQTREHTVEPIAVIYRWYAWYLLAYCTGKEDYRTYKLVRMENAKLLDKTFTRTHESAERILAESNEKYQQQTELTKVIMKCSPEAVYRIKEYMRGRIIQELPDGGAVMEVHVVEKEQWWIGTLLSLGDGVLIQEPEHIRKRVIDSAKKLLFLYGEL